MEGNKSKNKPRALLVFGAPCSGKTLFAEKFAEKFGLASYDLNELINEFDYTREQLMGVIEQILKTRTTILIEGKIDTERERTELRNLLRNHGYDPALIWIQTDISTLRTRLKMKYKNVSKAKKAYEDAVNSIEAPTDIEKPIILSGKHTFETQTRHALKGLAKLSESK